MHAVGDSADRIGTSISNFQRRRHLEPSDHRAEAAEERVACRLATGGKTECAGDFGRTRDPMLAKIRNLFRRPDRDEFPHAERLQPIDFARRFAVETIAGDVED
jgi:hypothetical protein